jgi:SAM-dependent methyltransferase
MAGRGDGGTTSACPVCAAGGAETFFESALDWSVRSDTAPIEGGARVLRCRACGHLFKPLEAVRAAADYRGYRGVFGGAADGDKMDFSARPVTRSDALIRALAGEGLLGPGARVLDFGCNRGAFLARLPPGRHAGYEVSAHYRPIVEGLGFSFHGPEDLPPGRSFGVVSLIHVLEHLPAPAADLKPALDALADDGRVLIEVPDPYSQPTDLYLADHVSHFSAAALDAALARAGLSPALSPRNLLAGEWTALYARKPGARPGARPSAPPTSAAQEALRASLREGERRLLALAAEPGPFIVYGAGVLGTLVASVLGAKAAAYVDDNPAWQGGEREGLKILAPSAADPRAAVVVAVPPRAAAAVAARARAQGRRAEIVFAPPRPE